jgi:hypothetical protein
MIVMKCLVVVICFDVEQKYGVSFADIAGSLLQQFIGFFLSQVK